MMRKYNLIAIWLISCLISGLFIFTIDAVAETSSDDQDPLAISNAPPLPPSPAPKADAKNNIAGTGFQNQNQNQNQNNNNNANQFDQQQANQQQTNQQLSGIRNVTSTIIPVRNFIARPSVVTQTQTQSESAVRSTANTSDASIWR